MVVIWFIIFLARFVKVLSGLVYAQRIRHYQPMPLLQNGNNGWSNCWIITDHTVRMPIGIRPHQNTNGSRVFETRHFGAGWYARAYLTPAGRVHLITRTGAYPASGLFAQFDPAPGRYDILLQPRLIWVSSLIREERENCCDDVAFVRPGAENN